MNLHRKLTVILALIIIPIIMAMVYQARVISAGVAEIGDFHTHALTAFQEIAMATMEGIEESFAYVVSGHVEEKQEFFHWSEQFDHHVTEFAGREGLIGAASEDEDAEEVELQAL